MTPAVARAGFDFDDCLYLKSVLTTALFTPYSSKLAYLFSSFFRWPGRDLTSAITARWLRVFRPGDTPQGTQTREAGCGRPWARGDAERADSLHQQWVFVAIFALPCGPVNYARMRLYHITAFDVMCRRISIICCSCCYSSLRLSRHQHLGCVFRWITTERLRRFCIARCASEDYIFESSSVICVDRAVFSLVARLGYMFEAASFSSFPSFNIYNPFCSLAFTSFNFVGVKVRSGSIFRPLKEQKQQNRLFLENLLLRSRTRVFGWSQKLLPPQMHRSTQHARWIELRRMQYDISTVLLMSGFIALQEVMQPSIHRTGTDTYHYNFISTDSTLLYYYTIIMILLLILLYSWLSLVVLWYSTLQQY